MGGYIGAKSGVGLVNTTLGSVQDLTATDASPEVTLINSTHEDTDGGREGKVIFKGQQSGGEESTLAEIQASHDGTADDEKGDLIFRTNDGSDGASPTERMRIDSAGKVGIGINAPIQDFHLHKAATSDAARIQMTNGDTGATGNDGYAIAMEAGTRVYHWLYENSYMQFATNNTERMRIHNNGTVSIGTTVVNPVSTNVQGFSFRSQYGECQISSEGATGAPLYLNRMSSDGIIEVFRRDGSDCGSIGSRGGAHLFVLFGGAGLTGSTTSDGALLPTKTANNYDDNLIDLGFSGGRFDDIYATNGTIQTSDENEKQNIASLTSAEITAATAISKLFKTFKWKEKVAAKGDNARTHSGVIAQEVEKAMSDAGLDAGNYAFFISTTWWEKDVEVAAVEADEENGIKAQDAYTRTDSYDTEDEAPEGATERNRKGIRYPELLAFIGAATEQRLTSIESRLTALEAE